MDDQFQIQQDHSAFKAWRLGLISVLCWVLALAKVAIHPHAGEWWQWPSTWKPVFIEAAWLQVICLTMLFFSLMDHLSSVELSTTEIVVHREIEKLPIVGRWFGPRYFSRPEWHLASTRRGLLIGKPSGDTEFQWSAERVFLCSKTAKPALKAWLAQLG